MQCHKYPLPYRMAYVSVNTHKSLVMLNLPDYVVLTLAVVGAITVAGISLLWLAVGVIWLADKIESSNRRKKKSHPITDKWNRI